MNKQELLKIIDIEEDNYNWGGSEDEDGHLGKGNVDWDKIKQAIIEL